MESMDVGVIFERRRDAEGPESLCWTLDADKKDVVVMGDQTIHMANIKETGFLSRPFMALSHAQVGVLDWHRVACKRYHFRSMLDVEVMEMCTIERLGV